MAIRRRILLQAVGVWLLLLGFAVINGLFRQTVLEPNLGPEPAHILSTTTLAGACFLAAFFFVGLGPGGHSTSELLAIGALWAFLTAVLELGLGLARGVASQDLFRDYDITRGRFFGLVLVAELFSPLIAGLLRRLGRLGR
ncbi:MAG: hypothetical protein WEF99_06735 [Thermoanaerobaculia bacterium]